jgi:hypothetical protein
VNNNSQPISEIKKSVKKGECTITIRGEFVIEYMDEFRKLANMDWGKLLKIHINARDVSKIDINGIQIILFLVREASNFKVPLNYTKPVRDNVCDLLGQCGFQSLVK